MSEQKEKAAAKAEKPVEKKSSPEKLQADFKAVDEFGKLWLEKDQSKEKFKRHDELEAAEKAMKNVKGPKAKKSQKLWNNRVQLTIVKGYPVSEKFAELFNEKQKKQYFTK
jgi:hypothetical protein